MFDYLSGKAFSVRLYGNGTLTVKSSFGSQTKRFSSEGDYLKEFIGEDATLTLSGPISYVLCDLVCFDEIFSEDEKDIPNGDGTMVIDARERLPDFLAFDALPSDMEGRRIEGVILSDGKIIVKPGFTGEMKIFYRKLPIVPTLEAKDAEIDIPAVYASLLPLLTAFYFLLDDESEKAEIYRELYEKNLIAIKSGEKAKKIDTAEYEVADGWA